MHQPLPRGVGPEQLSQQMTYGDISQYFSWVLVVCYSLRKSGLLLLLGKFGFLLGIRLVQAVYWIIVKVFIVGFCSVITVHTPTCRDLIFCRLLLSAILATVCCCSIDWWRRPIEQLYVIVKMLISGFCSESTVGCCHLAYRVRRKLRPHMRKLQTLRLLDWLKPNCLL